jgi:hypothetical protein
MGLTRGSRGESFMEHAPGQFNRSMREWSKRHLSFSGDWTSRFRSKSRSRSVALNSVQPRLQSPRPLSQALNAEGNHPVVPLVLIIPTNSCRPITGGSIEFPSTNPGRAEPPGPSFTNTPLNSPSDALSPHTGGGRHYQVHQHYTRPTTPTSAFRSQPAPHLQQSTSQGGVHYPYRHVAPRSARRWARTAHLHEVKQDAQARGMSTRTADEGMGREREAGDVFIAPAAVARPTLGRWKRDLSIIVKGRSAPSSNTVPLKNKEGEGDPWEDTDFDAGESEEDAEWELKVETLRGGVMSGKDH